MRTLICAAILALASFASAGELETIKTHHDTIPVYGSDVDNPKSSFDGVNETKTVVVPQGEQLIFEGDAICLDVLVRGHLVLRDGFDLKLRTLTATKTGVIEMLGSGTLTIRDMPIDTQKDPFQFGHALLVLGGRLYGLGEPKTPYIEVAEEIEAGEVSIDLASAPSGWNPGDELVIPDTRQPETSDDIGQYSETVEVASVEGNTVTLADPVEHDHLGWRNQAGEVKELFEVGNLTRSIVIRSENPNGTRGHMLSIRHSDVDMKWVEFAGMGRTTFEPLDNTQTDLDGNVVHVGTNQIARYPYHFHHVVGRKERAGQDEYQGRSRGLSVHGSPKAGVVLHGSYFQQVTESVIYDCAGVHLMTEWPVDYGHSVTDNLIVGKRRGSHERITARAGRNEFGGDHWHDSVGLGLASAANEITGNRIYSCKEGIGMAGFGTTQSVFKTRSGLHATYDDRGDKFRAQGTDWFNFSHGMSSYLWNDDSNPDAPFPGDRPYPFLFDTSGNKIMGCWRGIETWTANSLPIPLEVTEENMDLSNVPEEFHGRTFDLAMFPGLEIYHTRQPTDFEDQQETTLKGWTVRGDFLQVTDGKPARDALHWKPGYRFGITVRDTEVTGYDAAYFILGDGDYTRFLNCHFECPYVNYLPLGRAIFYQGAWDGLWEDCEFVPVDGRLTFIDGNYPKYDLNLWMSPLRDDRKSLTPLTYTIKPWRDGRNLRVYHYEQHPDFALDPIDEDQAYGDWPDGVYTHKELIERGTPIFGAEVPDDAWQSPEFGPFYVETLSNPRPETLEEAIEWIIENRERIEALEN